jgi:23S rRNA (guanosine2251-2'-O)-methyltransferase
MNGEKNGRKSKNFIFGIRVIMEAIEADIEIEKILLQKGSSNEHLNTLAQMARRRNVPLQPVPGVKLNAITRKNHQGAIAFLSGVQYASLDHIIDHCFASGVDPLLLVLDRITDVRNMGAIARTAECLGVDALVIEQRGNAMITSDAMKTSAGALNHLPVCRVRNLQETLQLIQNSGIKVVAASEKSVCSLYEADMSGPLAVVLGSEEDGVNPEILQKANLSVQIPVRGHIKSLNVSVAAGIVLSEVLRSRSS